MLPGTTRRLATGALAFVGLVHLVLAPEYLGEEAYIGVLFVAGGIALLVLAARLWRRDDAPAWLLGAATMVGMGTGFVLSRTTGLPGYHASEWELSGIVCLLAEAGFAVLAARAHAPGRAGARRGRTVSA